MQVASKIVVHQVHLAKIGVDVAASVVSNTLLWRDGHRPRSRCASCCPWPAPSLCSRWQTLMGSRYVLAHMPPSAQAVRLAGDALMGPGAHRRSWALLLAGAAVIAAGWSYAAVAASIRASVTTAT